MAQLQITINSVSASVTTGDAAAARLLSDYVAAYGGPTASPIEEQATWFVHHLANHWHSVAAGYAATQAAETERTRIETEMAAVVFE